MPSASSPSDATPAGSGLRDVVHRHRTLLAAIALAFVAGLTLIANWSCFPPEAGCAGPFPGRCVRTTPVTTAYWVLTGVTALATLLALLCVGLGSIPWRRARRHPLLFALAVMAAGAVLALALWAAIGTTGLQPAVDVYCICN